MSHVMSSDLVAPVTETFKGHFADNYTLVSNLARTFVQDVKYVAEDLEIQMGMLESEAQEIAYMCNASRMSVTGEIKVNGSTIELQSCRVQESIKLPPNRVQRIKTIFSMAGSRLQPLLEQSDNVIRKYQDIEDYVRSWWEEQSPQLKDVFADAEGQVRVFVNALARATQILIEEQNAIVRVKANLRESDSKLNHAELVFHGSDFEFLAKVAILTRREFAHLARVCSEFLDVCAEHQKTMSVDVS